MLVVGTNGPEVPMRVACKQGHEFTPENTYVYPNGQRRCRACRAKREHRSPKYRAMVQRWRERNRKQLREADREYRERDPEKLRESKRLSAARKKLQRQVEALGPKPDACQVCGDVDSRGVMFDHCHKTGRARGWLCGKCNSALGYAKDDPKLLRALADYLETASG